MINKIVDNYVSKQHDENKKMLHDMIEVIDEVLPETEPLMNYNMLAFPIVKGGKRDLQIFIGAFKNHCGLYPGPITISYFDDQLVNYKHSKGAIQFSSKKPLDKDLFKAIIEHRIRMHV